MAPGSSWCTRARRGCGTSPSTCSAAPATRRGCCAGGADEAARRRARGAARGGTAAGVVIAGEHPGAADAALAAAEHTGARFVLATRRAGDRGALAAGVHPALGPGGRRLDDPGERDELEPVWGPVMTTGPGRDTIDIVRAAAARELDVLYLVGVDPLRDVPDAALARRALQNVDTVVVQSLELGDLAAVRERVPAGRVVPRARRARERLGGPQPARAARSARRPGSAARTGRSSRGSRPPRAATSASTRSTSSTRRWRDCWAPREATDEPAPPSEAAPADGI